MRPPLRLEALEPRTLCTVSTFFNGRTLAIGAYPDTPNNVLVRPSIQPGAAAGVVDVVANGVTQTFGPVYQISFYGGSTGSQDSFVNRSGIADSYSLSSGNVQVVTTTVGTSIAAQNGNDIIQATGGNSSITVGNGNNNIFGGPGDRIRVGSGQNIVYDILPGNTTVTVAPHAAVDHLFVGPNTTLVGALPQDHVARFFAPGRTLGSGTLVQDGATLYFTADNAGDFFEVFPQGAGVVALYRLADGVLRQQSFTGVNQIAAFGGSGNDLFINATSIDDVMYGAGGVNVLSGGTGLLDLEKAGGAASAGSVAIGNSPVYNDLSGSSGTTTSMTLVGRSAAFNLFRSNSATDLFSQRQRGDALVTAFPDLLS